MKSLIIAIVTGIVVFILSSVYFTLTEKSESPYNVVAISWGSPVSQTGSAIYQVRVIADHLDNGNYKISGSVAIGGNNYYEDLGEIGEATDMSDAIERFGTIGWYDDQITIGGSDGVKATLMRKKLEQHR